MANPAVHYPYLEWLPPVTTFHILGKMNTGLTIDLSDAADKEEAWASIGWWCTVKAVEEAMKFWELKISSSLISIQLSYSRCQACCTSPIFGMTTASNQIPYIWKDKYWIGHWTSSDTADKDGAWASIGWCCTAKEVEEAMEFFAKLGCQILLFITRNRNDNNQ